MTQGVLAFQYQKDATKTDLTAFAGLMLYLDLFAASQLRQSVEKHLGFLDGEQGWTAYELLTSLASGFAAVFRQLRMQLSATALWPPESALRAFASVSSPTSGSQLRRSRCIRAGGETRNCPRNLGQIREGPAEDIGRAFSKPNRPPSGRD